MAGKNGLNTRLNKVEANDEGVVVIPFGFQVNGTSTPDNFVGDLVTGFTRSSAGVFVGTLKRRPATCIMGDAKVSITSAVDLVGHVDWTDVENVGTFTVRILTGATPTDPADNTRVGGYLLVKKTKRRARNAT